MNIKLSLVLILVFHGFLLASLMSVGQLIADRKSIKNWLFFGLLMVFCLFQIHYILLEMNLLERYKIFHIFPITALYLMGPLIYLITKHSLVKNYQVRSVITLHFLPVIIVSIFSVFVVVYSKQQETIFLSGYFYNLTLMSIGIFGSLLFLTYLVLSVKELISYYFLSKHTILNNPSALIVLIILSLFVLAWVSDMFAFLSNEKIFRELSVIIMTLIIIFLFLINFKYPEYYKIISNVVENEKKKRSYLVGINLNDLNLKLNKVMEKEEIFTDEKISLPFLARRLNISQHQLSQYLNDKKGETFSSFINKYRINKAKKILLKNPELKILAVAYEVGFQSKSTFNATFSKFVKMTPHEFREKYHNS